MKKQLLKVVYSAPRKGDVILEVTAHDPEKKTVDLAGLPGVDPKTGEAITGDPLVGVPLVADSVAGCSLRTAFARPHTWSDPEPEAAPPVSEKPAAGKKSQ